MKLAINIIEDEHLVENGPPETVRRTWKERLFSLPWKPLQATVTIIPKIPIRTIYKLPGNFLVMHPETAQELRRELEKTPYYAQRARKNP